MNEKEIASLPALLTVEEAAKLLRLKRSTAYEYVNQGLIPSSRVGRFIRIPKTKLLEATFLKEQTAGTANI